MEKAPKLAKLDRFRRAVPHVSASALSKILQKAVEELPELKSRRDVQNARDVLVTQRTDYGPLLVHLNLECNDGTTQQLAIINPFAQLFVAAKTPGMSALLRRRLESHPNSFENPWHLALYSDEVSPGNQLAHHNARKSWAIYWGVLEFGLATLSDEDAWFCTAAERTDRLSNVTGGIGQVFTVLLKHLFGPQGHTLHSSGVRVFLDDGQAVRLFIKLQMFIQDGAAHKYVFFLKGDAGTRFCVECRTIVADKSGIHDDENEDQLKINLVRKHELMLDFATNEEIRGTVRRLAAFPPAQRALREQACGYNHCRFNMLLEPSLDSIVEPISQKAMDWMHCFFVHGVWNTVLFWLLMGLHSGGANTAVPDFHDFVHLWTLPGRLGGERAAKLLAQPFERARWTAAKKAKYIKCQASVALSLCPIVCYWLVTVFHRANFCVDVVMVYLHCADIVDLILSIPHCPDIMVLAQGIDDAVDKLLSQALDATWQNLIGPKWHWMIHLGDQLRKHGCLLSCFVHERKHKTVKRFGELHRNTRHMEESILADVTMQHLYDIEDPLKFDTSCRLQKPVAKCNAQVSHRIRALMGLTNDPSIYSAMRARCNEFEVCHVRDVVLFCKDGEPSLSIGQVYFFFQYDDHAPLAIIARWPTVSREPLAGSATVQMDGDNVITIPASDIKCALTYKRRKDGNANVLVPSHYRVQV